MATIGYLYDKTIRIEKMEVKIMRIARQVLLYAVIAAGISPPVTARTQGNYGPPLETVMTFNSFKLVGIAVSQEGRIFASAPAAQSGNRVIEVDVRTGTVIPYPDEAWNTAGPDTEREWVVPQAMWVDKADHLWVLDSGRAVLTAAGPGANPKLVEFDLTNNKVMHSYGFDGTIAPTDSLNDVRIDLVRDYAYLTNIGNRGSLVVLELKTGKSRQVLVGDRSTFADPHEHLMIGDRPAEGPNGNPVAVHADGIALSPDAAWVYYRPLTDHNYWRVPTSALIDAELSPAELSSKVQFLGTAEMTGGLIMDRHGTLYGGDLEHSTVVALTVAPATDEVKSRLFIRAPGRLSWADGFAISQGYLYIADSHLWEVAFKNHLPRSGPFTIFRAKLPD
jgi:sugar lactone lactonase YvrE